ncbi:hypothetical protein [Paraburkholderia hospita]|uniref:Peptidase M41 domain-containing protein n=1 Tax=Paraburkholderia hospita TaxID=169430 RepID=A0AAN1JHB8_9BURK|nr:hypothetical protein [Paraburkholderia hospita]AUT74045.1 hypothetical protein C2L64_37750 [Paraburkholderia hospita]EIN02955.1 hypothetical protein WQE_00995 [Paraburkholderia hospita]OUL78685.1 hypothetical protein CA602_31065 [Paraburkholderia hospita]OUL85890.1 hypothetical protein CA601_23060 [Paraburkholderia hospita]SEH45423.1 hypothetical protein SAMN05192544_100239 [Paraburkholderia hospita]
MIVAMNRKQIEDRERRNVAVHEAGHLAILKRFGGQGQAAIWPNESVSEDERSWLGNCAIHIEPGSTEAKAIRALRAKQGLTAPAEDDTTDWKFYVGLAGEAATCMIEAECNEDAVYDIIDTFDEPQYVSASDMEWIGSAEAVTLTVAERMVAMLREEWTSVTEEAKRLVEYWVDE